MAEKRKHTFVSMQQKLAILERLDKGESVQSICREFKVGKSTVNDWRRNRKSIETFCTQIEGEKVLSNRCTLIKPKLEQVDDALWLWFMQERRRGTPISGPILKEKAMILHKKLEGNDTFTASDGWLSR
ncbi:jerky protein homolog [Macrosteles quadrilineatus]|uniref:jerky protein homolog n=1 Tax=Macrosteles quadrilineatus TaxID=74068 RepID=UPI0023E1E113|nr:jerky protein homolog [Macrosteles quadrilineatus]